MSKVKSINFHFGFPRIGPKLTRDVSEQARFKGNEDIHIVSQEYFRKNLRTAINTYHLGRRQELHGDMQIEDFESDCAHFEKIVISQPSLLGYPRDLLTQGRLRNRALTRVQSISRLFQSMPLTAHLLIEPQADYLARLLGIQAIDGGLIRPFSWYELANGIQEQLGNHKLIIWDYREPEHMEAGFLTAMAGNGMARKDTATRSILQRIQQETKQQQREATYAGQASLMLELDDLYQDDLEKIDLVPGVQLIKSRIQ